MKINFYVFIFMVTFNVSVGAEVFKCRLSTGKTVYQTSPCAGSASQRVLAVEQMTPEQTENAKIKLKVWQQQQANDDAMKAEVEKQRRLENERQEALELQRRSVIAQEQQAIAAQQQNQVRSGIGYPQYRPCFGSHWGNYDWEHNRSNCNPNYPNNFPPPMPQPHYHPRPQQRPESRPWSGKPIGNTGSVDANQQNRALNRGR